MGPHLGTKETSYILFPRQQLTDLIFPPSSSAPIINYPNQSFWRGKLNKQVDHYSKQFGALREKLNTTGYLHNSSYNCGETDLHNRIWLQRSLQHFLFLFFFFEYICMCESVYVYKLKFHRYFEVFPIFWIELIQIVVILYICYWPLKKIRSLRRIVWLLFSIRIRTCA